MLAVPVRSSPATVRTPGMVAGAPTWTLPPTAVARGGDDHDVLLFGVEECRVPALRPFRRRAAEGDVDDAGAVVDGPAHCLGIWSWSLLPPGLAEPSQVETDSSCASGATPTTPSGPTAGPAAGPVALALGLAVASGPGARGRRAWWPRGFRVRVWRRCSPGRWPSRRRKCRAAGQHAGQIRMPAVHAAVNHGDLDAGALGNVPGFGDAGLGEPVFLVPPGVGVRGARPGSAPPWTPRRRGPRPSTRRRSGGAGLLLWSFRSYRRTAARGAAARALRGGLAGWGTGAAGWASRIQPGRACGLSDAEGNSVKNIVFAAHGRGDAPAGDLGQALQDPPPDQATGADHVHPPGCM